MTVLSQGGSDMVDTSAYPYFYAQGGEVYCKERSSDRLAVRMGAHSSPSGARRALAMLQSEMAEGARAFQFPPDEERNAYRRHGG